MMPIKGVIFDCDGVMFESRQANLAYYNDILNFFGEDPVTENDREKADLCHTAASPEVLTTLLGAHRITDALEFAARIDYRKFIPFMVPEPGLYDVLEQLAERVPLAVATNRGSSMPEILDHFELTHFFSAVVTSCDVKKPKPHPDMLLLAVEQLELGLGDVLFVGDSRYDHAASESAGVRFAAYKSQVKTPLRFSDHYHLMQYVLGVG